MKVSLRLAWSTAMSEENLGSIAEHGAIYITYHRFVQNQFRTVRRTNVTGGHEHAMATISDLFLPRLVLLPFFFDCAGYILLTCNQPEPCDDGFKPGQYYQYLHTATLHCILYIFWHCAISSFAKFCSLFSVIDKIGSSTTQTICLFEVIVDDNKIQL